MANNPNPAPEQNLPQVAGGATAPIIFCDGVAAYGVLIGIAEIELATRILTPSHVGEPREDVLITGRLRLTANGLAALKDAIQKIETVLAPTEGKAN